jgi:ankyrin repeat protein
MSAGLVYACKGEHIEAIRRMLARGDDPNSKDNEGTSCLFWALQHGSYSILRLLLEHGADVNTFGVGRTLLAAATELRDTKITKLLLEFGADVNKPSRNGYTPLMGACEHGCIDMVNDFVDLGATVNACDKNGFSPLMYACWMGYPHIVERLIALGADISVRDRYGYTASVWAGLTDADTDIPKHQPGLRNMLAPIKTEAIMNRMIELLQADAPQIL